MSVPNRESVAEALKYGKVLAFNDKMDTPLNAIKAAARAWLDQGDECEKQVQLPRLAARIRKLEADQGDALVIRKVNGEWPEWALKLVDHMGGRRRAWQILDALGEAALSDRSDNE